MINLETDKKVFFFKILFYVQFYGLILIFLFSILIFSGLIEGVIVMSIVSYLSVQGMLVFLDCKHALLSRKKLHSDQEGIIIISLPKRFL
jgi:hypothetical protein